MDTFAQFIVYLGTPAFASVFISEFLEHLTWFQNQSGQTKSYLVLASHIILAVFSLLLRQVMPSELVHQLDPLYQCIMVAIGAFVVSQYYHAQAHGA